MYKPFLKASQLQYLLKARLFATPSTQTCMMLAIGNQSGKIVAKDN